MSKLSGSHWRKSMRMRSQRYSIDTQIHCKRNEEWEVVGSYELSIWGNGKLIEWNKRNYSIWWERKETEREDKEWMEILFNDLKHNSIFHRAPAAYTGTPSGNRCSTNGWILNDIVRHSDNYVLDSYLNWLKIAKTNWKHFFARHTTQLRENCQSTDDGRMWQCTAPSAHGERENWMEKIIFC